MAIDFSALVYVPVMDTFARGVTVHPRLGSPYTARGVYDTTPMDVVSEDGSILSDTRTILDIRDAEFAVMPKQRDRIEILAQGTLPEVGMFEVLGIDGNGAGLTTLTLRRVVDAAP